VAAETDPPPATKSYQDAARFWALLAHDSLQEAKRIGAAKFFNYIRTNSPSKTNLPTPNWRLQKERLLGRYQQAWEFH